eukprot:CAMPEP_0113660434 /NCGR_PEP_ID=MMETSP0017_2-20120614/32897_1 /TAXON_ID=2856 /ORGANISM="Cylindrotheca closterium" /LENGTH=675 /DNA_ID=CAMNT_0000575067 /DNA_START=74 /DNA_END=2098 /DNA_ORIENTATION=- /assembly_acc=CAM_ASM_000147
MTTTPSSTKHLMVVSRTASVILLLLHLGLISALQQRSVYSIIYNRHTPPPRHLTGRLWSSAPVDREETTRVAYDWDEQFEQLLSFKAQYGHCRFPQNAPENLKKKYPTLEQFCRDQRVENNASQLAGTGSRMSLTSFDRKVRFDALKEIGFGFKITLDEWMGKYNELVAFRKEHGHFRVLRKSNPSLRQWIYVQRQKREEGTLTNQQIQLLDDIEFPWENNAYDTNWYAMYNELVDFKNKHGHLLVEKGTSLYDWMHNQRRQHTGNPRPLSDERIRLLNDIDFEWTPARMEALWLAKYNKLVQFQQDHGHCQPKASKHKSLYDWSLTQRNVYEEGVLSTERIKLLDKIDFPWKHRRHEWNEMCRELVGYCNQHGHLRVSENDNPDLHEWMGIQRQRYHGIIEPALSPDQIEKLEQTCFCWSLDWRDRTWHEKYTEIVEFFKEHDHVRVIKKDNPSLYNWIQTQEKRYKEMQGQKPFSKEELELLEQVNFPFLENQSRMAWNDMYAEVQRYQKKNKGSFPSHKDDPDLNRWMRLQRNRMRNAYGYAPLSDEQKELLDSINFPMLPTGHKMRSWYEKYDELIAFRKKHGHFLVDEENPSLRLWVRTQRAIYKKVVGSIHRQQLSKSQIYLMERIGFPWTSDRFEIEWQMRFDELVQFVEAEGNFPANFSQHPVLHKW